MKTIQTNIEFFLLFLTVVFVLSQCNIKSSDANQNIAMMAVSTVSQGGRSANQMPELNDGLTNIETGPFLTRAGQPTPRLQNMWVQYEWSQPVKTKERFIEHNSRFH